MITNDLRKLQQKNASKASLLCRKSHSRRRLSIRKCSTPTKLSWAKTSRFLSASLNLLLHPRWHTTSHSSHLIHPKKARHQKDLPRSPSTLKTPRRVLNVVWRKKKTKRSSSRRTTSRRDQLPQLPRTYATWRALSLQSLQDENLPLHP